MLCDSHIAYEKNPVLVQLICSDVRLGFSKVPKEVKWLAPIDFLCSYNPDQTFLCCFHFNEGKKSEGKGQLIERVRDLLFLELHISAKILLNASASVLLLIAIITATYLILCRSTLKTPHRKSWLSLFCRWKKRDLGQQSSMTALRLLPLCTYHFEKEHLQIVTLQQQIQCKIAAPNLGYW